MRKVLKIKDPDRSRDSMFALSAYRTRLHARVRNRVLNYTLLSDH